MNVVSAVGYKKLCSMSSTLAELSWSSLFGSWVGHYGNVTSSIVSEGFLDYHLDILNLLYLNFTWMKAQKRFRSLLRCAKNI
jgi:hypothetical protein